MSNQVNEIIQDKILDDVLDLYKGDVWNVIRAIENEFGFDELRFINDDDGDDGFINKLVELRFDALCAWGG